jgi:REP element-mobilizing transposase RayT
MNCNPDIHHRRSIRLTEYDYSQAGMYFVTVCAHGRECLFGEVMDEVVRLNGFGGIVGEEWLRSAEIRKEIILDEFIIMPNHIHGIIIINNDVGPTGSVARKNNANANVGTVVGVCRRDHREIQIRRDQTDQPDTRQHRLPGLATQLLRTGDTQ